MIDDSAAPTIDSVTAAAYTIPTDAPESDGTLEWDSTTLVLVQASAAGEHGIGWTYAHPAAATVVTGKLADLVTGRPANRPAASFAAMHAAVRNLGRPGLAAEAISATDVALWDLHAKLLGVPLTLAIGAVHQETPIYGSGGFTSYDNQTLADQLRGWADAGIPRVKMKVGRDPAADPQRLQAARDAIGDQVQLFVDANGAYSRKQALEWAERFADAGVVWFEEPVSSDDLAGLRLLRDRGPAGLDIAAGEYGYDLTYFHHMLQAEAVDCLQADVTRCGGISGFLRAAALCDARCMDISLHCAPQVSAHAGTAAWHLRHLEYFHDHVRIEGMAFDGVLSPVDGALRPDPSRPGMGLQVKTADLEPYRAG